MRRLKLDGVRPLEVWDWPVQGRPLQAFRTDPFFPVALAQMVTEVRQSRCAEFTHVYLTGGGVSAALSTAIASAGFDITSSADPVFAAARAGARLFDQRRCLTADLGQTSLKVVSGTRALRIERDLRRAPFRAEVSPAAWQQARASTIRFLAEALSSAWRGGEDVVLALPCELGADGVPRGSTYCWAQPDPSLVPDLAREAGIPLDALNVLNDAELAALAADEDPGLPRAGAALVLTMGFGVGGAVLDRTARGVATAPRRST